MQPFLSSPSALVPRVIGMLRMIFVLTVIAVSISVVNLAQMLSLIFYPFSRPVFRKINGGLAVLWWSLQENVMRFFGVRVLITGDRLPLKENALLLGNHQEMSDIPSLIPLARAQKSIGSMKWFAKEALKHVPGPGWGMRFIGCVFLARNWADDKASIERTFHTIKSEKLPAWLIMFLEGTRITEYKLQQSQEYARRRGHPIPQHTMVPRTKGFLATIEGLRDYLDAVYDVTIAYPQGIPTLWQFMSGHVKDVHINVRRFPMRDLPEDPEALRQWVVRLYQEKDALLAYVFAHGAFPPSKLPGLGVGGEEA